jgi:hypothetical protein
VRASSILTFVYPNITYNFGFVVVATPSLFEEILFPVFNCCILTDAVDQCE